MPALRQHRAKRHDIVRAFDPLARYGVREQGEIEQIGSRSPRMQDRTDCACSVRLASA
jgi:hypothetical protein